MQGRGLGVGAAPGGAQAPVGVGDGAAVEGRQAAVLAGVIGLRRADDIGALQEEGALLGHAQREAGVAGELGLVEFHLREVGVERGVDDPVGARPPLDLGAQRGLARTPAALGIAAVARAAQRELGPQGQEAALAHLLHQVAQAVQRLQLGDEAQGVLGQGRGADVEPAVFARDVACDQQAPRRAVGMREAQRGQRPAQLDAVAVRQQGRGGLHVEVGGRVVAVVLGTEETVFDRAGRADAHELGAAALADRVDVDRDEVLVALDLVAPGQRRTDALGGRVPGADAKHQGVLGDQHLHRGAPTRSLLVDRQELHEVLVDGRALPGRVVEPAVDDRRRLVGWQAQRGGVG
jgi:hypothetical protein